MKVMGFPFVLIPFFNFTLRVQCAQCLFDGVFCPHLLVYFYAAFQNVPFHFQWKRIVVPVNVHIIRQNVNQRFRQFIYTGIYQHIFNFPADRQRFLCHRFRNRFYFRVLLQRPRQIVRKIHRVYIPPGVPYPFGVSHFLHPRSKPAFYPGQSLQRAFPLPPEISVFLLPPASLLLP